MNALEVLEKARALIAEKPDEIYSAFFKAAGDDNAWAYQLTMWYADVSRVCSTFGTKPLAYLDSAIAAERAKGGA